MNALRNRNIFTNYQLIIHLHKQSTVFPVMPHIKTHPHRLNTAISRKVPIKIEAAAKYSLPHSSQMHNYQSKCHRGILQPESSMLRKHDVHCANLGRIRAFPCYICRDILLLEWGTRENIVCIYGSVVNRLLGKWKEHVRNWRLIMFRCPHSRWDQLKVVGQVGYVPRE